MAQTITIRGTARHQLSISGSATQNMPDPTGQKLRITGRARGQLRISGGSRQQIRISGTAHSDSVISLSQNSASLTLDGTNNATDISIIESGYAGVFSLAVADPTIATAIVSGSTLTVTGIAVGATTITIIDDHGNSITLPVSVLGSLSAIETTPPNSYVGQFVISKPGYIGSFTVTPVDPTTALISPLTSLGPGPVVVTVTPKIPGSSEVVRITDQVGGEVDLIVSTANLDLGRLTYTLLDSGGVNPLPPMVFVQVYPVGTQQIDGNLMDSGYTLVGGRIELDLPISSACVAVFTGTQAPKQPVLFTSPASSDDTDSLTIIVEPYTSPVLSKAGYANAIFDLFPEKWLGDTAKLPTGVAFSLFTSMGSELALVDTQAQKTQASMRLDSSEGIQLESYAADFLGDFPRYPNEVDDHYRARIKVALKTPNVTREAIRSKVQAYIDGNPAAQQGSVLVFDLQSDPELAAQVGIVDGDGKFCVLLPSTQDSASAFFAGRSYVGRDSYVVPINEILTATNIDPNIVTIVKRTKAGGYRPVFAQVQS